MIHFSKVTTTLLILIVLLVASSVNAITPSKATFILTDGTQYDNVPYRVDYNLRIVKIEVNDEKLNLNFLDIEKVLDLNNSDITDQVLKRENRNQVETWRSERDHVYKQSRQKLWTSALGINLNYSNPLSSYYEGIDPGIGFGGDFMIPLTHNVALKFTCSKSGMKVPDDLIMFYSIDPNYTITDQDISIRTLRFLISGEYYVRPDRVTPGKTIYYCYSGMGLVSEKVSATLSIYDNITGFSETGSESISESYFDLTLGGGMIQLISPKVGIEMGVSLDMLYISSDGYYSSQNAYIFDFKLGLITLF